MSRFVKASVSVVALLFALTACGGGSDPEPAGSSSGNTEQTQGDILMKYAECMRDNGVQIPDPDPNDPGSLYTGIDKNSPAFLSANKVCGAILQGVIEDRTQSGEDAAAQQDELLALAQCLREHGINVPDPVPGQSKPFGDALGNRNDPAVSKAIQECNKSTPPLTATQG